MPAHVDIQTRYLTCYEDPRDDADFDLACYPVEQAGGRPGPEGVDEWKRKFLAVYARRNVCVRALAGLPVPSPERARLIERTLLFTEAIDHLEDVGAAIGFVAEPVMDDDMFVRELAFTHAPLPAAGAASTGFSSFSLYIPIPLDDSLGRGVDHAS